MFLKNPFVNGFFIRIDAMSNTYLKGVVKLVQMINTRIYVDFQ